MSVISRKAINSDGDEVLVYTSDDYAEGGGATLQDIVDKSLAIESAIGDETTASEERDPTSPATAIERLTALVSQLQDLLQNEDASDELRVALATDILSGDLDVNLNNQSGDVNVSLSDDSLSTNLDVDLAEQSAGDIAIEIASQTLSEVAAEISTWSAGTLPVEQQTPVALEDKDGNQIDPATNPAIKGGSSLQDIVDAISESALAQIEQGEQVETAIGDETTASQESDSTVAADLLERVTALVDVLTSGQADDELRVALATDLLSGNLDVNVNGQSGDVDVNLATDSLTGNLDVDLAEVSSAPIDVSASEVDVDINSQSLSRVTTAIELTNGTSYSELQRVGSDLGAAVQQWNAGVLSIQEDTPLDVSASVVNIQEDTPLDVSAQTVTVTDQGDFDINSLPSIPSGNNNIGSVDIGGQPLDVSAATVSVQEATALDVSAATVPTEQQTPVGVEDIQGTQIDPATDPGVRGGATQQDIVDALMDVALSVDAANEEGTLLTDATTAQSTSTQTVSSYKGVIVWVNIDSISGTSPSLTAKIQRESPGGVFEDVLSTGSLTNTGLKTLQVHPSVPDVSNERAGELLGRDWRVDISLDTADGDESYQYDIEYTYIE